MTLPERLKENKWVLLIALLYIAVNMVFTLREVYFLNLIPIVVFIVILAVLRLDTLYFIIVFLTPISVPLIEFLPGFPIDFAIPTEPVLFGVMLITVFKIARKPNFDKRILNHPVSYAILFHLFWIFVASVVSSMPVVSFKFLLARCWFLITYYFLAIHIFRNTRNITVFIWCYTIPMILVVLFATSKHLGFGLYDKEVAHWVMNPFFRDHTSYGAILAMIFFALGGVILRHGTNFALRVFYWGCWFLIVTGLILSYTRAAWLSVAFAFGILLVTLLKIKFRYLAAVGVLVIVYFGSQRVEIQHKLQKNRQDSSADLAEHVQSISNITTDDSNLERLNRWSAALNMFAEKPVFGWGPGTYMFNYAPFQLSRNKTLISTNFGNKGNAHSEYIGPLAEMGILGSLSFMLIAVFALITGFRVYHRLTDMRLRQLVLALILGLITYLVHGSLNNFLDTDKASALFWGFIAVFVSLDIYYLPKQERNQN
jgi:O-antigen ligase